MLSLELMLQDELTERFRREYIYKKTLYDCIWQIWKVLNLFFPFPVCDVMDPLEQYISVEFRKHKNTRLCGMINKNSPPEESFIFINTNNPKATQLFSLYHEVMHWFFHPPTKTHFNIMGMGPQSIEDYQANEGAAEMLVPYRVFIPWVAREISRAWPLDIDAIQTIKNDAAERFHVSNAIIYYRLESLKYEIYQYMNGVDLKSIKFLSKTQLQAKGIVIESLNDFMAKERLKYYA